MPDRTQAGEETSAGVSMCGLYLGGAAHADDVRAIASSATAAEPNWLRVWESTRDKDPSVLDLHCSVTRPLLEQDLVPDVVHTSQRASVISNISLRCMPQTPASMFPIYWLTSSLLTLNPSLPLSIVWSHQCFYLDPPHS